MYVMSVMYVMYVMYVCMYSQRRVVRRDFSAYHTLKCLDSGTFGENRGFQGCSKQVPVLSSNHQQ